VRPDSSGVQRVEKRGPRLRKIADKQKHLLWQQVLLSMVLFRPAEFILLAVATGGD
jgi:hypothetical protein